MDSTGDQFDAEFAREFEALASFSNVQLNLTRIECFILLGQIQLALRHPENAGDAAMIARAIAETLENAVSVTPALARIARQGWNDSQLQENS